MMRAIFFITCYFIATVAVAQTDAQEVKHPIKCPVHYHEGEHFCTMGNSYAQIQTYGSRQYLHPGIDILTEDYTPVYNVKRGIVKAIITIGSDAMWRIAISDGIEPGATEGYLYAHLVRDSIRFVVGDTVEAGEELGVLYPWPVSNYSTHLHFSRIITDGEHWNGNWRPTHNTLLDISTYKDTAAPIFDTINNAIFTFRSEFGHYLSPESVTGKVQLIFNCYDVGNTRFKTGIYAYECTIAPASKPANALVSTKFKFNMNLDRYVHNEQTNAVVPIIYSMDKVYTSESDYVTRNFFYKVLQNGTWTPFSINYADTYIDMESWEEGNYTVTITAFDAGGNSTSATMPFTVSHPKKNKKSITD